MTEGVFLLLGSNMGDKRQQLATAVEKIGSSNSIIKQSCVYETAAWGNTDQPSFYNQVIQIRTDYEPDILLQLLLQIELQMGRERDEKWGERIIDIDILYYDDQIVNTNTLTIPHPEIPNRRFTLVPLVEIAGGFVHPKLNLSQDKLLSVCQDKLEVVPI